MRSKRYLQYLIAALVVLAVASCSKGGSGGCPPGQTLQGSACVPQSVCAGNSACADPPPCGPGGTCPGGGVCVAGACSAFDTSCTFHPPKGPFVPRVAWQWTGSANLPQYDSVLMTPVVVPLERAPSDVFAPPAVVFNSMPNDVGAGSEVAGVMRAVSGRDGSELWTSDPAHLVNALAGIAGGDLRGDGQTIFVTARNGTVWPATDPSHQGPPSDDGLIAFDSRGHFLWEVPGIRIFWGAPSIANLYGRADSQVVIGATVVDANGAIVCRGTAGQGDNFLGAISTVADVDLDGVPDIVTGNTVYDNHCQPKPGWPNGKADGLVAVANFTGDAHPEIVVVSGGTVRLQDWQGKVVWGPVAIPGNPVGKGGGPPTVADFDGDGKPEVGVAGNSTYTVFKPFAANPILWSRPTQDTSMVTGSSVFDFEHDGKAEVVYGDECYTRVYDGTSGGTLFEAKNPSCTTMENPVIADVDKDGRAEIVVATNSTCQAIICKAPDGTTWTHASSGLHGVTVYKDLRDHWVSTRPIWNQHAYHVTNVNDDGSIPQTEAQNWQATGLNDFRMNVIGDEDFRAPDLAAQAADASLDTSGCPARLTVKVQVWNRGAVLVAAGVPVALYAGAAGGTLLATAQTQQAIVPGASELVTLSVNPAPGTPTDLTLVLNDDGTGQGVVGECGRANNAVTLPGAFCAQPSK